MNQRRTPCFHVYEFKRKSLLHYKDTNNITFKRKTGPQQSSSLWFDNADIQITLDMQEIKKIQLFNASLHAHGP